MMGFPSIPGWDGIHPVMVQFAIVLLLVAPLLLLISLFTRATWRTWAGAALLMMGLGTLAAWVAVGSGHAAGQLVDKTPALVAAVTAHEALGVRTLTTFLLLTLVFAALLVVPAYVKRTVPTGLRIGVLAAFFLVYLGFATVILNTADRGGRLVHDMGVKAMLARQVAANAEETTPATPAEQVPKPQAPPPSSTRPRP